MGFLGYDINWSHHCREHPLNMYPQSRVFSHSLFTPKIIVREMSATKPALLRAFAESFASPSPYRNVTQKETILGKRKMPRSSRKLRRKVNQIHHVQPTKKVVQKGSFASSFLYAVQPICAKNPLCLFLNAKFCKDNRLENNTLVDLTLQGVIDKHWVVEFVYRDNSDYQRKAILHNGFQEFIEDNDLKEGDELVFHLMPCTLGNTTRPWFQVFIKSRIFCPSSNQALDQVGDQVFFPKACNVMNHEVLPSPSHIVIRSPNESISQELRPPIERSYKLVFNGRVVRHFFTLEYDN